MIDHTINLNGPGSQTMIYKLIGFTMSAKFIEFSHYLEFSIARTIKYHKPTTAGTGNLPACRTRRFRGQVNFFHTIVGNTFGHTAFLLKSEIQYFTNFMQSAF